MIDLDTSLLINNFSLKTSGNTPLTSDAYADDRTALTLILGPAEAGKTEWTLQRFQDCRQAGEHALLIVSSPQQALTRIDQLARRMDCAPADIQGGIRTFRQLTADLTAEDKTHPEAGALRLIGRPFQRLALADLFRNTIRSDDYLGRMLNAPGFVPALSERLREWKLACITPEILEQSGPALAQSLADPTYARKAAELARLFRAYETFLMQNRLRDDEDTMRYAVDRVQAHTKSLPWNISRVLVDGFYRFNPMQRLLLAALAQRDRDFDGSKGLSDTTRDSIYIEVAITLPYEEHRPLLFAAPARTLTLLRQEFDCRETILTHRSPSRPHALSLLSDHLFDSNPLVSSDPNFNNDPLFDSSLVAASSPVNMQCEAETLAAPPVLQLFDAPNPYVEAEMVAREFRRLYDAGGYCWSDFAVILRAMGDYAPILAAVFERHGIPLGVDGPETLTENPLIKTLLHFLTTVRHGWQRDDVLAFLKSSYTSPDKLEADALRQRARRAGVREGRERWLQLVQNDADMNSNISSENGFTTTSAAAVLRDMAYFDRLLTRERQDPREFARLIVEIVGSFGLEDRIAQGEPKRQQRDRAAWDGAGEVLQALAQMAALSGRGLMTFDAFYEELQTAWQSTSATAVAPGDMVRVAEPYDARERPLRVAAVMGLTERMFPRRITEDPFLRDEERVALRVWAGLDLEEQKGRSDDERFFFYLAVTAPTERLLLSYPRSADDSDTLPSFYLDEVRALFDKKTPSASQSPSLCVVSRTLADVAPRPEEVVSNADRLLAACAGIFDPGVSLVGASTGDSTKTSTKNSIAASHGLREALNLMATCLQDSAMRLITRRVIASRGLPLLPRLHSDPLRAAFATNHTVFSVSELESYGRCPFQYFLRHVLRLQPEEESTPVRAQGTLLHAVLHRYFAAKQAAQRDAMQETENESEEVNEKRIEESVSPEAMRLALQTTLDEMLAREPLDASPHQIRLMHRLLSDALNGFVTRELRFTEQFGMTPTYFELAFGHGQRPDWEDEERLHGFGRAVVTGDTEPELRQLSQVSKTRQTGTMAAIDLASYPEPLFLHVTDGGPPVALCGTLDRVDLDISGRRALIIDYKLGRPPDFSEIQRGHSLQMPLYLLAVERLFGKVGAVACYDSMRERGRRRFQRTEHINQRQFMPLTPLEDGTTVTPLNRGQYTDLLKTAEATAVRIARAIASGNTDATPGEHCRTCSYNDVCRTSVIGGHDGETIPLTTVSK